LGTTQRGEVAVRLGLIRAITRRVATGDEHLGAGEPGRDDGEQGARAAGERDDQPGAGRNGSCHDDDREKGQEGGGGKALATTTVAARGGRGRCYLCDACDSCDGHAPS